MVEQRIRPTKIPESVLVVIHTEALEVLLLERADRAGFWQSVTGSRDSLTEDLRETAMREVFEETGIVVARDDVLAPSQVPASALVNWHHAVRYEIYEHWRHRYAPGVTHNVEHWWGLTVPRDITLTLAAREHTRFAWLDWQEAAQRCFSPSNRDAILQLPQRCQAR
ncbi:MAG TPA: dihydroneopterin triphosphate diphosphatase [Burkholderiaceae bacterium]|nr:dihydroneopterin triphosphate diphosphatase [Burkholderiaceae bacterium]